MASRSRRRQRMSNHTPGNTRTDAALDAMRPYGFDEKLVRETVNELLDVYEGTQGWPFIEEASYKLLIETILSKQQVSSEEKDNNATEEGETVTSVRPPPTRVNSEAGSSNLEVQDSLLVPPQTNNARVSASPDGVDSTQFQVEAENERISVDNAIGSNNRNVEAKKKRLPVIQSSQPHGNDHTETPKPRYGRIEEDTDDEDPPRFLVEAENERMPVDNAIGSNSRNMGASQVRLPATQSSQPSDNDHTERPNPVYGWTENDIDDKDSPLFRVEAENERIFVDNAFGSNGRNVDANQVRLPETQSSQPPNNVPIRRRKRCYGWIGSDADDENDLIQLPMPPLSEELMKYLQLNGALKSGTRRRRKSRWDEKPDDVIS